MLQSSKVNSFTLSLNLLLKSERYFIRTPLANVVLIYGSAVVHKNVHSSIRSPTICAKFQQEIYAHALFKRLVSAQKIKEKSNKTEIENKNENKDGKREFVYSAQLS